MVEIRKVATPDSLASDIQTLLDQIDHWHFGPEASYDKSLASWWIAYDGEIPVGYCGGTFWEIDRSYFLCRVAVHEQYRGKGIQRQFMELAEADAKEQGAWRVVTYVANGNLASANNFIKAGFRLYSPHLIYGLPGCYYFEKRLS